jgi:hypothetical protein
LIIYCFIKKNVGNENLKTLIKRSQKYMDDIKLPIYVKLIPVIFLLGILGIFSVYGQDVGEVCILRN